MDRKQNIVNELHKRARRNFTRRRVVLKSIDDLWQADLVEMHAFSDENNGYNYILTIIDGFSKYAWAVPLKNKRGLTVTESMINIFRNSNRIPKNLQTDMGNEFYNKSFTTLMTKHEINHYSSYSILKASIVERFNRTLKEKMWKMFSYQSSYKWIDKIEGLVKDYNNSIHRTIKMAPIDVNNKRIEKKLLDTVYKFKTIFKRNKFKIGDHVRITRYKKHFEKGYETNWSPEIFKIIKISNKFPVTYLIQDYQKHPILGRFYEQELQKVSDPNAYLIESVIRKKGDKIFVKWLGFDNSHNSWINKKDAI